jgi:hypothetical protein
MTKRTHPSLARNIRLGHGKTTAEATTILRFIGRVRVEVGVRVRVRVRG